MCSRLKGVVMKSILCTLVLLLLFANAANAQMAGGSISGTVAAESGAPVPNVHISVKELSTGLIRSAATNTAGIYSVPDLSVGAFEMTVTASGFVTQLWTGINVTSGVERILNVVL